MNDNVWSAIIGTAIGGAISAAVTLLISYLNEMKERQLALAELKFLLLKLRAIWRKDYSPDDVDRQLLLFRQMMMFYNNNWSHIFRWGDAAHVNNVNSWIEKFGGCEQNGTLNAQLVNDWCTKYHPNNDDKYIIEYIDDELKTVDSHLKAMAGYDVL